MICTASLGVARRKIPVSPCILELLGTYERVIEQALSSPPFRDRSERRLNKSSSVLMHRKARNQYLTLTEACSCASFLHGNQQHLILLLCRNKGHDVALLIPRGRFTAASPFPRRCGEKHHSSSRHPFRSGEIRRDPNPGWLNSPAWFFLDFVLTSIIYRALRNQEVNYVGSIANNFRHISLFTTKDSQKTTS